MTEVEIDLTIFLIESIVTTKQNLFKDIDKLYEKHKYKAYKLAKSSPYYSHGIFCNGSIEKQIYGRKLLGLINLATVDKEVRAKINILFKKAWSNIYKYIENFKGDKLKIEDIFIKFLHSKSSVDEINGVILAIVLVANCYDVELDTTDEIYQTLIGALQGRIRFYSEDSCERFDYHKFSEEIRNKSKQLKQRIEENYGEIISIESFVDLKNEDDEALELFLNYYLIIFETENLSEFSRKISKQDIEEICALYYLTYKNQNVKTAIRYLISALYLKITLKEYNDVKDYYFKNNKETLYLEIEDAEDKIKELTKLNEKLISENKILKNENHKIKRDYKKQYTGEITKLKSAIDGLQNKNDKLKENEYELFRLREYAFSQEHTDIDYNTNNDIEIPKIRGVVVGGYINWRRSLEENMPNTWNIIRGDNANIDLQFMNDVEIVLFNVAGMNHKTYYKIRNRCQRRGIKYYFIPNNNFDIIKYEIYKYWSDSIAN